MKERPGTSSCHRLQRSRWIRMMLNSAGHWYVNPRWLAEPRRQPDLQGGPRVYQSSGPTDLQSPSRLDQLHRFLHRRRRRRGPDRGLDRRTIKATLRPTPASGLLHPSRVSTSRARQRLYWGGSSWYVLASSPAEEKAAAIDSSSDRLGWRRRLLPEIPCRPGRRRHVAQGS